jgi:UDP-GlcNAc3NAcA epimerase
MSRPPRILTIVGARPQFVKAGVVSQALAAAGVEERLVHTGQHYDADMSAIFFEELGIPAPTHHLGIGSGSHGAQTGRMLEAIEQVILDEKPDRVLVYGDTNSTLAGAVAASKLHVPIDHIEAGLRSFNRRMPEEINRVVTDHLSALLFAPTDTAVTNLANEGIAGPHVVQCGDVMHDATLAAREVAATRSDVLDRLSLEPGRFILATVHRAESTDDPVILRRIVEGLVQAAIAASLEVVLPLHPRTRGALERAGLLDFAEGSLRLTPPVGYLDMTRLESAAALVATDSGGVQKEAFFHRVPCVTLRSETEWVELVELGWNKLADPGQTDIAAIITDRLGVHGAESTPYGDGRASEIIARRIAAGM